MGGVVPGNPFAADAAERYHRGRPRHHRATLGEALRSRQLPRGIALDVACGTGLSTAALAHLGFPAVGLDASASMAAVARRTQPVALAVAEALPVARGSCSLVVVASAIHWFDQERFAAEARRALHPEGLLCLLEHAFLGDVPGDPRFAAWVAHGYTPRFPAPERGRMVGQLEALPGFEAVGRLERVEAVPLDHQGLVDYLLTQSGTIAVVERGEASVEEVAAWLREETAPFFGTPAQRIGFSFWSRVDLFAPRPER